MVNTECALLNIFVPIFTPLRNETSKFSRLVPDENRRAPKKRAERRSGGLDLAVDPAVDPAVDLAPSGSPATQNRFMLGARAADKITTKWITRTLSPAFTDALDPGAGAIGVGAKGLRASGPRAITSGRGVKQGHKGSNVTAMGLLSTP